MSKRVLICEDDHGIRLLLDKLLNRHGLSCDSASTGAEAIARLREESYDLVLLDLILPMTSGYEVLAFLERHRPELLPRVIVVTALQRAFREALPVAAVVRKPFDIVDLDRLIERILRRSSNRGGEQMQGAFA